MKQKQWLSMLGLGLGLAFCLSQPHAIYANPTFGGGSGTKNDPYRLSTPEHLTQLQVAVDGKNNFSGMYFILTDDIDLSGYDNDSDPANGNFNPIGRYSVGYQFSGHLDGKGYTISNLRVHSPSENGIGLFAYVLDGEITNLNLENVVIEGFKVVGGLTGHLENSVVNQVSVSGEILGDTQVGGLAGQVLGSSTVENSHSSIRVTGTNGQIGGLVGNLKQSAIEDSSALGDVSGGTLVGGLLGQVLESTVENSRSSVTVIGSTTQVGGFAGRLADGSTVRDCQATGSVEGTNFIGGLVGATNLATIEDSSASGDVVGNNSVGGLVGYVVATTIEQSLASGNATGTQKVGGLTGHLETSTIHQSSATGDVEGTLRAGGLSGYATGSEFDYSYSAGSVMGEENIGGFAGYLDDSVITNSYSVGDVTGEVQVGGFVGQLLETSVDNAYAIGNVVGEDYVGGFAGQFVYANMDNIYVVGNVEGSVDVGGLVGNLYEDARIENAYYVGQVVGDEEVGHLVGWQEDTSVLESVYYDREKNVGLPLIGLNEADEPLIHVVGLTTNQMTQGNVRNYMPTFDFETVWITTSTTPMFRWQTHLVPASQGDVQVSGTIQPLLANVIIPSVSPDLVINPNLPDSVISPEFSIDNRSTSPIRLELKTFEQTTNSFNDVLPDKYASWETLNKTQSQDIALGLITKAGEGWQRLTTPISYVANHQAHEIGVMKPMSQVNFEFEVHHGRALTESKTVQYKMVFVFDLLN